VSPERQAPVPLSVWRTLLLLPAAVAGVVLPVDFLGLVDGYLMYLRPIQLLPVYGWAWWFYAVPALVVSAGLMLAAAGLAAALRKAPGPWAFWVMRWVALVLCVMVIIKDGHAWLNRVSDGAFASPWWWQGAVLLVAAACGLPRVASSLISSFARPVQLLAVLGSLVALVALLPFGRDRAAAPAAVAATVNRPDVVLITIDTIAAQYMSLYGYARDTTPRLAAYARGAAVFERFYANANFTTPTVNAFINGVRPWTHRALQTEARVEPEVAAAGLVARLRAAGYQTFAVSANANAAPSLNRTEAFFDRVAAGRVDYPAAGALARLYSLYPYSFSAKQMPAFLRVAGLAERVAARFGWVSTADPYNPELSFSVARAMVASRDPGRPMFLWVHVVPPHDPYATPGPFIGRFDASAAARTRFDSSPPWAFAAALDPQFPARYAGRYDEAVAYVDAQVGDFLDWLEVHNRQAQAVTAISADHGESFTHGYGGHGGPLLHEPVIRIPLVIRAPGQTVGQRVSTVAEQIDLMPTLLDLASVPYAGPLEGRSLRAALAGEMLGGGRALAMTFEQSNRFGPLHTGSVALIEERWKYVHYVGRMRYPAMPDLTDSLYDLVADPGESNNLIRQHSAVASRMRADIEAQLRLHGAARP
jgi:arylsulfatase A-like enzyme